MHAQATRTGQPLRNIAADPWVRRVVADVGAHALAGRLRACRHLGSPQPVITAAWRRDLLACPPCAGFWFDLAGTKADRLCDRCGRPLGPDPSRIDLGHRDNGPGWSGLEHARCNRQAGARLGNARRRARRERRIAMVAEVALALEIADNRQHCSIVAAGHLDGDLVLLELAAYGVYAPLRREVPRPLRGRTSMQGGVTPKCTKGHPRDADGRRRRCSSRCLRWYAFIEAPPAPDGRRRRQSLGGHPTRKAAEQALRSELARRDQGISLAPARTTLSAFAARWLAHVGMTRDEGTAVEYGRYLHNHVLPVLAACSCASCSRCI